MSRKHFEDPTYQARERAAVQSARRRGQAVADQLKQQNLITQRKNERIAEVLQSLSQQQIEANPRQWWNWWQEYIDDHPDERAAQSGLSQRFLRSEPSALSKGTPVWTNLGRQSIEQIRVGDFVLAQHPVSGELAYKPVLEVMRAILPTQRVDVEDEEFRCAAGLAFWSVDHGWWLADDVSVGSHLHAISGPQQVIRNAELIAGETYHLVVADFSSFVIGQQGLLVHDAKRPEPVRMRIPGLAAKVRE